MTHFLPCDFLPGAIIYFKKRYVNHKNGVNTQLETHRKSEAGSVTQKKYFKN
jgi:hypothetical protein